MEMRKLLIILVLVVISCVEGQAITRTAISASYADVNDQVSASADGDTVIVPAGTPT